MGLRPHWSYLEGGFEDPALRKMLKEFVMGDVKVCKTPPRWVVASRKSWTVVVEGDKQMLSDGMIVTLPEDGEWCEDA